MVAPAIPIVIGVIAAAALSGCQDTGSTPPPPVLRDLDLVNTQLNTLSSDQLTKFITRVEQEQDVTKQKLRQVQDSLFYQFNLNQDLISNLEEYQELLAIMHEAAKYRQKALEIADEMKTAWQEFTGQENPMGLVGLFHPEFQQIPFYYQATKNLSSDIVTTAQLCAEPPYLPQETDSLAKIMGPVCTEMGAYLQAEHAKFIRAYILGVSPGVRRVLEPLAAENFLNFLPVEGMSYLHGGLLIYYYTETIVALKRQTGLSVPEKNLILAGPSHELFAAVYSMASQMSRDPNMTPQAAYLAKTLANGKGVVQPEIRKQSLEGLKTLFEGDQKSLNEYLRNPLALDLVKLNRPDSVAL